MIPSSNPNGAAVDKALAEHINPKTKLLDNKGKELVLEWAANLGERDFVMANLLLYWTATELNAIVGSRK